jgi:SAM-dependent methyltransferase
MNLEYPGTHVLDVMGRAGTNYNRFLTDIILRHSNEVHEMLDFGAGTGTIAEQLRQRNTKVLCVEPDVQLRRVLAQAGFRVEGSIDGFPPRSFRFCYVLNVLEHIENDLDVVVAIKARTKPGGRLLIFVPAFKLLYSAFDRKLGHFRRYTTRSLASIVERAGFTVESSQYADSLGFFAALIYRFLGSRTGNLDYSSLRIYDSVFFPLSRLLDRLFHPLFGKNVILLARRPEE